MIAAALYRSNVETVIKEIDPTKVIAPENHAFEKSSVESANVSAEGKATSDLFKCRIIRLGLVAAASMQLMKVGGFLFEHGVAFYAYAQYAPKTLWGQYFYANATHQAAQKILSVSFLSFSITSLMTGTFSIIVGVVVAKGGAVVYNLLVDREKRISITVIDMISDIFSFVFPGTLL